MLASHQDRVAVVTGAARGIGQAVCRQLAERGATVVAVDLTEPDQTLAQLESPGQIGEADDVAGAILFLTSQDSYFVTGQTIMADGGLVRM